MFRLANIRRAIVIVVVVVSIPGILNAQNIYVSPSGDDVNPGTQNSPKRTIQAATELLSAGDTLYLRGGEYHEEVYLQNFSGIATNPIVFKSFVGETPVLDGSIDLKEIKVPGENWELASEEFPGTANIYKLQLEEDIWQLWVRQPELMTVPNAVSGKLAEYRMQVIARWPNGNTNPTDPLIKASNGIDAAANTWWSMPTTWAFAASPLTSHTVIENNTSRFDLAGTGKSFKGGAAILSIVKQGPANTPVQILEHEAGSNVFIHSGMDESYGLYSNTSDLGPSYIIQHLNALDSPGEWYYDDTAKIVYLWPEDNSNPNSLEIRGKTQSYAFDLVNCEHIVFDGLGLFGTSMRLNGEDISFMNGAISYPDMPKTLLGYSGVVIPAIYANDCRYFTIRNCVVEYSQSSIIEVKNVGSVFDNNYFHHLGMTGMGASGSFHNVNTFINNTIRTVGNRAAVKANSDPQSGRNQSWNILDGWGFLYANDGVGFQSSQGGSVNSERGYNWFIKSNRSGHRYDGPDEGLGFPTLGLSHHLVALRGVSVSTTIKGDYNQLYNYLGILSTNENGGIAVRWNIETGEGNKHTIMRNCAADGINIGKWDPLPCINTNNWDASKKGGSMLDFHPEADILDFRPKAGSPLINAGYHVPGITDGYLGSAPDIGAYEWGDDTYWIPGYKTSSCSLPIPFDGAEDMKLDRDLIFSHAYKSDQATVYFGTNKAVVLAANRATSKEPGLADIQAGDVVRIDLADGKNIISPTMLMGNPFDFDPAPYLLVDDPHVTLTPNTSYYWRADAIMENGNIVQGDVWTFVTGEQTQLVQFKIFAEEDGVIMPASNVPIRLDGSMFQTDSAGFIYGVRFSPGTYNYIISKKGYSKETGNFLLETDTLIKDTIHAVNYQVELNITDVDMYTPVGDANVSFGSIHNISDKDGMVEFSEIEYGFYKITVAVEGYHTEEILEFEVYSDTLLPIFVQKDYRIGKFLIFDKYTKEPIHRAEMSSLQGEIVLSDEAGEITMNKVAPGWWIFTLTHGDYFSLTDSLFITEDTTEQVIYLTKNKANVTMKITDSDGPVSNAKISFDIYNTTSSQQGEAWFFFLAARQDYAYTVEEEGYATLTDTFFLETDTILEVFLEPLGIADQFSKDIIRVYPNPFTDLIHIEHLSAPVCVRIIHIDGRHVLTKQIYDKECTIDLSKLHKGIYFLEIEHKGAKEKYKILKL